MVLVGRLKTNILAFAIVFLHLPGISYASHLKGNLQVFFPSEISTVSLASLGTFCVARQNADPTALKAGIDWACGPGLANCGPIQPGQACYIANNLVAIASYAYDAYYQANQATGGTCFFNNTAMLTNSDPREIILYGVRTRPKANPEAPRQPMHCALVDAAHSNLPSDVSGHCT